MVSECDFECSELGHFLLIVNITLHHTNWQDEPLGDNQKME